MPPRPRIIGKEVRTDLFQSRGYNSYVGNRNRTAFHSARKQEVAGLSAKEGDRRIRLHRRAHDGSGVPINAARQIDRHHEGAGAIDRLNHLRGKSLNRPIKSRPEKRIDDDCGGAELRAGGLERFQFIATGAMAIEQRPARLDLTAYPHLPKMDVKTTCAADYAVLAA